MILHISPDEAKLIARALRIVKASARVGPDLRDVGDMPRNQRRLAYDRRVCRKEHDTTVNLLLRLKMLRQQA